MMDERELDRAIDTAAARMMAHEPGRALSDKVMARVRERNTRTPMRFVWIVATAGLVACGAISMSLMYRAPLTIIALPPAAQLPLAQPPIAQLPMVADAPVTGTLATLPSRRSFPARTVALPVRLPLSDVSVIEAIETEPIVLSAIEVPQLPSESTSIETLNIEPLTIQPLAASN